MIRALDSVLRRCKYLKRSLCCVLGQGSLLSQCLSPGHSGVDMSTAEIVRNTQQNAGGWGGATTMD